MFSSRYPTDAFPEKDMEKPVRRLTPCQPNGLITFIISPNQDFQLTHTFQKSDNLEMKRE